MLSSGSPADLIRTLEERNARAQPLKAPGT
jgi:hypothetical protein